MADIIKAKLKKSKQKDQGGLRLISEYSDRIDSGTATRTVDCDLIVHPDLMAKFRKLDEHLAAMTNQREADGKISDQVVCRAFSLRGDDEGEGVVLSGHRILPNGKALILNSPFIRFDDDDAYSSLEELVDHINECEEEVKHYLFSGKHLKDPQGELFENN